MTQLAYGQFVRVAGRTYCIAGTTDQADIDTWVAGGMRGDIRRTAYLGPLPCKDYVPKRLHRKLDLQVQAPLDLASGATVQVDGRAYSVAPGTAHGLAPS